MSRQGLETLARPHVPDSDALVEASRHDEVRLRVEVAAKDVVAVALQRFEAFAGTQFPDFQSFVIGCADEKSGVAGPSDIRDAELVAADGLLELAVVGAPDLDELVGTRARQPLAVRTELDGRNCFRVTCESELECVVGPDGTLRAPVFHVEAGFLLQTDKLGGDQPLFNARQTSKSRRKRVNKHNKQKQLSQFFFQQPPPANQSPHVRAISEPTLPNDSTDRSNAELRDF